MSLPARIPNLDRRQFVKHFALSSAASIVAGKLWTARVLADVGLYGEPIARIPIRVSDYPGLQEEFGSVQFKFTATTDSYYPFTLTRTPENLFYAVDTRCTHAGCIVGRFTYDTFSMICDCHGSQFNHMGEVVIGPAVDNLWRYATEFDGEDTVTVFMPGIDMKIHSMSVQSETSNTIRLRLDFPTIRDGRYRVQFRQNLHDLPVEVPFAITPLGPADQNEIVGEAAPLTVYVDAARPRGFFSVALVVDQY